MQDNPKLQAFHESLVKSNYGVPDYPTFEATLKDPVKSKQFFDALVTDRYELPDYETFVSDLGLKKKEESNYGLPSKEVISEMFGNISKPEAEEVSTRPLDEFDAEKFKTPDLSLKSPEFKGPELESLSGTVAKYVSGERITEREFKAETEKRIQAIDTRLKELPKAKMQVSDVGMGVDIVSGATPEEDEKLKLQAERTSLAEAITTPNKAQYLFSKAYSQSLIGLANKLITGSELVSPEWMQKYDAGTLTDATATALGFMLDMPFFGAMGKVGGKIGQLAAKPIVDRVMANSVKKYVAAGMEESLAKKLALKSATKVAQSIAGMTSSGVALGSYGAVGSALGEWAQPDASFDDIKWSNAFKRGAKDFLLGTGVGGLGLGVAALASKASAIPNMAGRIGTKVGIAGGGLTAESALFAYGGALLDGRAPNDVTGKEFMETVALLGMLKASNVVGKIPEAVANPKKAVVNLYKSLQYDPKKPGEGQFKVDIQPWEINPIVDASNWDKSGKEDYTLVMEVLAKDDIALGNIMKSKEIPALLKQKILWGARGVAINDVNIMADKVVPNEEYVELYNKEGVLVDKWKFTSREEANQVAIDKGLQLEDNKMQMNSALPEVDKVKIISDLKNEGKDIPMLLDALDKPVADRTTEENKAVGDYAKKIPKPKKKKSETAPEEVTEEKPLDETPDKPLTKKQKAEAEKVQAALDKASKPKRTIVVSEKSETGKILRATPQDLHDSISQLLLEGNTLDRADFIRHSGWGNADIKESGLGFFLNSKNGIKFDVLRESLAEVVGREKNEIPPSEIVDIIKSFAGDAGKISRRTIIDKFKERHKETNWQDAEVLSPEVRAERELDDDIKIAEQTGEFNEMVKEAEGNPEIEDALRAMQTEAGSGVLDWNYIKDKAKNDPQFFVNNWLWDLKPEQIGKLNEILSNHGEQIKFEERASQHPSAKSEGKGNELSGRTETPPGTNGGKEKQTKPEEIKPDIPKEKKIIEDWLKSEGEKFISVDWDGEFVEIFKSRDRAVEEYTRNELIEKGVNLTEIEPNEKPVNESNPPISKGEENNLQAGTEPNVKPVEAKGEEKPVSTGEPEGIKFKDKTYQSVDEVLEALDKGDITFEESKPLREQVDKFEETNKPESFSKSKTAKQNKKYKNEPLTDKPEELAWDEPLPLSIAEDPNFKNSDLNNAMSIRNLGRNLIKNLGLIEGADVRTGFIKRFSRKARGLFNPSSGVIRVNNIRDLRALTHEIGHKLDFEIFDIRGIISASKKDPSLGGGVDFNGETYSDIPQVERAMKKGTVSIADGDFLIDKVKEFTKKQLKEKYSEIIEESKQKKPNYTQLRQKYGKNVVDGVLQRTQLKKEFLQLLKDIGYPSKERTEGIAEFVYNYVIDPKQLINSTPNALAWFEKMLDNAPAIKDALHTFRQQFAEYDAQDVRIKGMAEVQIPEEIKTPWLDGLTQFKDKMLYSLVNQLQYLEKQVKEWEKLGDHPSYKNPWVSAKELIGIDGKAQQFLLYSPYNKRGNDIVLNKTVKPLIPLIKHLIGTPDYLAHQTYLVALDAIESHNRQLPKQAYFDRETAVALKNAFEKQYGAAKLMEFQNDIQRYNESLLDFMTESGRISKETSDYWKKEHQNYVPLKRIAETYEKLKGKQTVTRDMLPESEKVIFARKGSAKQIKDIFESMIENTYAIVGSSERNLHNMNIRDMFFDFHRENQRVGFGGAVIEEINPSNVVAYQHPITGDISYSLAKDRSSRFKSPKGRILIVYEQGKPRFYDIAPEYYDNIFQSSVQASATMAKIIRVASAPSRWLQAGAVVYDPTFPIRNVVRDQISAWFYSKHKYMPTDFIKGLTSAIKKDDYYQKWMASGGDQSFLVSSDQMISKDYASKKIGPLGRRKFESYRKNPLLALQDFSKASEIGTRLGAFRNAYKKTGNVHLAAIESRDVSADYGIKGAVSQHFVMFYPFLNARTQHLRMTVGAMKNPAFLAKGLAITIPALLNWLNNNKDEETKQLYQSLSTFRRLAMFNIRIPGTDHFFPLPKGFFGTMFGTSIESMLDAVVKDDPRVLEGLPTELFKNISPVGNIMEGVPFIMRPQVEMWANKKGFTGKPIVSESMKLLRPSEQYYNGTPEIIKKIGEALNWSPLKIQHYLYSYTGGAGSGAVNILDEVLQQIGVLDQKPEDTFTMLSRMPVFKALLTEKPIGLQSGYVSDFYDTLDKIAKTNVTFNKLVATNEYDKLDKFMQDPENQRMYSFYEGNSTAINSFRNSLIWIRETGYAVMKDPLLNKEQRQNEVERMNQVVQETLLKFNEAYEKNAPFEYGKSMDEIIKKMKDEKKDSRYDLIQQSNLYNPHWMKLREKNPEVFNMLKEFGGMRDLKQNRSITKNDKKIALEMEDVRLFNDLVIEQYGKNVGQLIGTDKAKWKSLSEKTSMKDSEKTRLDEQLQESWDRAYDQVKYRFKPQMNK